MTLYEKCDGCAKTGKPRCVEFCPNEAFTFQDGKAWVSNPAKCGGGSTTVHCSACAPLCHKRAIVFPQGTASLIDRTEKEKGLIRRTTCKVCGKVFWTNSEKDVCFDCKA